MTITNATKRKSYEEVLLSLGKRQHEVFSVLSQFGKDGATAGELARLAYGVGVFPNAERNNVHPRLNELVAMDAVEIAGKRKCNVSGRTCAIYRVR